jgi:hypothetical protein
VGIHGKFGANSQWVFGRYPQDKSRVGLTLERHRSRPYRNTVDSAGYMAGVGVSEVFCNSQLFI